MDRFDVKNGLGENYRVGFLFLEERKKHNSSTLSTAEIEWEREREYSTLEMKIEAKSTTKTTTTC